MKLQGQAIVIDALDIRNRKLHHDRRDRACLKLKVAASSLHSHLLAFAATMSWWRAMCVVGKVVPSSIRLSAPVSRLRTLGVCPLRVWCERTAMFISRTGVLLLEHSEFSANIFYLVLTGNHTMGEPFDFGVVLPDATLLLVDVSKRR
jgi:hypothetical protein